MNEVTSLLQSLLYPRPRLNRSQLFDNVNHANVLLIFAIVRHKQDCLGVFGDQLFQQPASVPLPVAGLMRQYELVVDIGLSVLVILKFQAKKGFEERFTPLHCDFCYSFHTNTHRQKGLMLHCNSKTPIKLMGITAALASIAGGAWHALSSHSSPQFEGRFSEHPPVIQALIERTLENMVYVEGGSFMMGNVGYEVPEDNPQGEWLEMADGTRSYRVPFPGCSQSCYPVHKVTLSGYYIHKFETTMGEYDTYTLANDLPLVKADERGRNPNLEPDRAVYFGVDWHGANDYCQWLADETGLPFGLPTEAQWEYAARSRGKAVKFATDNGELEPGRNYRARGAEGGKFYEIEPIGKYPPNPLGLYDMTGNANEWVRDWYSPYTYRQGHRIDPTGPPDGDLWATHKVSRGFGRQNSDWRENLVFRRLPKSVDYTSGNGFRCAIHSDQRLEALLQSQGSNNA